MGCYAQGHIIPPENEKDSGSTSYRRQKADGDNNPFYTPDMAFGIEGGLNNLFLPGVARDSSFYFLPSYLFYIEFRLSPRLIFKSGLGGSQYGPKRLRLVSQTEYDTGGDHHKNVTETYIDRLSYLNVPVMMNYNLSSRWQASTGIWLSWFIAADNRQITSYYINDQKVRSEKDRARNTFSSYFTWWDVQVPVGLYYRFNGWISASAIGFVGLRDITPDGGTISKWPVETNTNSGYRLSLKIRLL